MDILDALRADYQNFPHNQTYELYADDVYFKDPMTAFRGKARYQQMIGFIDQWFLNPTLELHDLQRTENQIRSDWTLSWNTPLPWKPRIQISGWSDLLLNEQDKIISHIDYWHCSKWEVLKQHFPWEMP
jgi:Uncharacterized conserved protein (DUF2358)